MAVAGASARRLCVRAPRALVAGAAAVLACALSAAVALSDPSTGDYAAHGAVLANNAGPAVEALARGRVLAFIHSQPTMGLSSLLLRAPLVAAVRALGGGDLLAYQLGAAICLLNPVSVALRLALFAYLIRHAFGARSRPGGRRAPALSHAPA